MVPEGHHLGESDVVLGENRLDGIVAPGGLVPLSEILPRGQSARLASQFAPLLSRGGDVVPSSYRGRYYSVLRASAHGSPGSIPPSLA